jgi:hypothetical protein
VNLDTVLTDSLAHAAITNLAGAVEHWHDFYLLAGTAAVTLVGLLFVALSFHLDTLLRDDKAHLLGTARMAFTSFVYVLMLSLGFLAPGVRPRYLAVAMLILSLFLLGHALWVTYAHRRHSGDGSEKYLRRRYTATGFIAGIAIVSAGDFLQRQHASTFYNFGFIVAVMLVNASSISWDLLVQVGRLKLARERTGAEGKPV